MTEANRRFEFDDYIVDLTEASITRSGERIHIEPRALELLGCLLRNRGHLVTKRELLDSVWQGAFVGDNSLARAVARVRKVLGDDAHEPRYIETVHTHGYRFVGEVRETEGMASSAEAAPVPVGQPSVRTQPTASGGRGRMVVVVALVVLVGAIWVMTRSGSEPASAPASRPRVAVLPFKHLGPVDERLVAAGLTEELTSGLAAVPELAVISRQSADHYGGVSMPLGRIGSELSADFVVEGTLRAGSTRDSGPAIRATVQLIRVADDTHVWSQTYERPFGEVLETESWLAAQILRDLRIPGVDADFGREAPRAPDRRDAYQAQLEALSLLRSTHPTRDDIVRAIKLLKSAVEVDPEYTAAWCYLSLAHSALYWLYDSADEVRDRAREAAEQASFVEPDSPLVQAAFGAYYFYGHRDYERALEHLTAAQAGRPSDDFVAAGIGLIRRRQGKHEEALEQLELALALNPRSSQTALWVGWTLADLRRYAEATQFYDRAIALAPGAPFAYRAKVRNVWLSGRDLSEGREILAAMPSPSSSALADLWFFQYLYERDLEGACDVVEPGAEDRAGSYPRSLLRGLCLALLDRAEAREAFEVARLELEASAERAPDEATVLSRLGIAYAGLGRPSEAVEAGRRAVDLLPTSVDSVSGYRPLRDLALVHAMTGDVDSAVDLLAELLEGPAGQVMSTSLLELDPRFDPLRNSPRFRELLAGAD